MTYRIYQKTHRDVWVGYFSSVSLTASASEIDQDLRSQGAIFNVEISEPNEVYAPLGKSMPLKEHDNYTENLFYIEFESQEHMMEFILKWS